MKQSQPQPITRIEGTCVYARCPQCNAECEQDTKYPGHKDLFTHKTYAFGCQTCADWFDVKVSQEVQP